jgi:hypothetical protein
VVLFSQAVAVLMKRTMANTPFKRRSQMNEQLSSITNELFSHNAIEILDGGDTTDALYDALVEKANIVGANPKSMKG